MREMNDRSAINPDDALADRLHLCAMAERPAFSAELHRRVTATLVREAISGGAGLRNKRWARTAAAVILAALIPLVWWSLRSGRKHPSPRTIVRVEPSHHDGSAPTDDTASVPGSVHLISATLWPPALMVRLPISASFKAPTPAVKDPPAATPPIELPGSPDWLLAALQQPEDRALSAVDQVVPPHLRDLLLGERTNLQ